MDEPQFVIVGVAQCCHTVPVRRSRRMDFAVQAKALCRMGDLHQAGNPAIVVRVGAHEIGRVLPDSQLAIVDLE